MFWIGTQIGPPLPPTTTDHDNDNDNNDNRDHLDTKLSQSHCFYLLQSHRLLALTSTLTHPHARTLLALTPFVPSLTSTLTLTWALTLALTPVPRLHIIPHIYPHHCSYPHIHPHPHIALTLTLASILTFTHTLTMACRGSLRHRDTESPRS